MVCLVVIATVLFYAALLWLSVSFFWWVVTIPCRLFRKRRQRNAQFKIIIQNNRSFRRDFR